MGDDGLILEARGVGYAYAEAPVLADVDIGVRPGEIVGIIGPNGSGKSTLLRLMAGLMAPVTGSVWLEGQPIASVSPSDRARAIAWVPQSPTAAFAYSALQLVLLGRGGRGWVDADAAVDAARGALVAVDAAELADRTVDTLSGGERQRVFIARALAQCERGLLLDEPTNHLDPGHQMSVWSRLERRARDQNLAVLAVLHDVNIAGQFCDRVILLDRGRVVAAGPPAAVICPDVAGRVYGVRLHIGRDADRGIPFAAALRD